MADLLGRDRELSILFSAVAESVQLQTPRVAVVSGEAGIGKTRLLTELSDRVTAADWGKPVLVGYGQALATSLAAESYSAIRECLRSLIESAESTRHRGLSSRIVETLKQTAPDWLEAIPAVGSLMAAGVRSSQVFARQPADATPDTGPLDQLITFIDSLAATGPLLLVLDDLHWADPASVDLLVNLGLKVSGPVTVVLAYREDDTRSRAFGGAGHPIRRGIFTLQRYRSDCITLALQPLSAADIRELVYASLGDHVPAESFVSNITTRSVGNPLFAESLVQARAGGSVTDRTVAHNRVIMSVLEDGLDHLQPSDVQLLETAATIGPVFELEYLARLLRVDPDELCDRLDILMAERRLLDETTRRGHHDRYTFHHPLLAEVLEERARGHSARWRRTNRHLVDILQEDGDEATWDEAQLVRAVSYAVEAEQHEEAHRWAMDAGRRQFFLGAISKARDMADVAVTSALTSAERFAARQLLVTGMTAEADHEAAVRECDRALADLDPGTSQESVFELKLVLARSLRMVNEWARMDATLASLETDAAFTAAPQRLATARMLRAEAHLCGPVQDLPAADSTLETILELSVDAELRSRALGHRGLTALAGYDAEAAETWLQQAITAAESHTHPYAKYEAIHWLSKKSIACLELQRAEQLVLDLMHVSEGSGVAAEAPFHLRDLSRTRALMGQQQDAADIFCRYFDVLGDESVDRGLMTLLCQLDELEQVLGPGPARAFLDGLSQIVDRTAVDPHRRTTLSETIDRLTLLKSFDESFTLAAQLRLDAQEAQAAEAIFRFDVPSLAALRDKLGTTPGTPR